MKASELNHMTRHVGKEFDQILPRIKDRQRQYEKQQIEDLKEYTIKAYKQAINDYTILMREVAKEYAKALQSGDKKRLKKWEQHYFSHLQSFNETFMKLLSKKELREMLLSAFQEELEKDTDMIMEAVRKQNI